jgi:hypothetical protein
MADNGGLSTEGVFLLLTLIFGVCAGVIAVIALTIPLIILLWVSLGLLAVATITLCVSLVLSSIRRRAAYYR